jgi:hypothetical protein
MNNTKAKANLALIVVAIIVVVVAAVLGINAWALHEQSSTRSSLASGYATQALGAPFILHLRSWEPTPGALPDSGQWVYQYDTNLSEPPALAAAKAQLGRGAYQVDANHPDVIGQSTATLYRDLITEDVALKVTIGPVNEAAPGASATTPVTVTLSPLAGE